MLARRLRRRPNIKTTLGGVRVNDKWLNLGNARQDGIILESYCNLPYLF